MILRSKTYHYEQQMPRRSSALQILTQHLKSSGEFWRLSTNSNKDLLEKMTQLKQASREPEFALQVTGEDLNELGDRFLTLKSPSSVTSEVCALLCNVLVLNPILIDKWNPQKYLAKVINWLSNTYVYEAAESNDTSNPFPTLDFILTRLLVLMTFNGAQVDSKTLRHTASILLTRLRRVRANIESSSTVEYFSSDTNKQSFIELLKLLFNILHHYGDPSQLFHDDRALGTLMSFLGGLRNSWHHKHLLEVYTQITNCLLCFPSKKWLFHRSLDSMVVLEIVLGFTEALIRNRYCPEKGEFDLEDRLLSPPLTVLRAVTCVLWDENDQDLSGVDLTPSLSNVVTQSQQSLDSLTQVLSKSKQPKQPDDALKSQLINSLKNKLREKILPSAHDRNFVLGTNDSLSSLFLKLTTDPILSASRSVIYDTIWRISNQDPDEFVHNFGLGFASSFLASRGLAIPDTVSLKAPTNKSSHATGIDPQPRHPFNPVTGQYYTAEAPPVQVHMSQEEKERDAERISTLFERLKSPTRTVSRAANTVSGGAP